jgi:glutathione S-transferase
MASIKFWGVTASPYQLKMQALADYSEVPWQRRPDQTGTAPALATLLRLRAARARGTVRRFPDHIEGMDEYPAVPYYSLDGKNFYYDSTGLALHLDSLNLPPHPIVPKDAGTGYLCRLIDDAFDEFGLYMVHHNRWVVSAKTNVMADTTVRELRAVLPPPARSGLKKKLARRQVRRCPYLFSVAPPGYECGMPGALTPPSRAGFPPTHELLDTAWRRYLSAVEGILAHQPFLLGERFTLADASAYGQLGMNLADGRAADLLQEYAPRTFQWLCMIRDGGHRGSDGKIGTTKLLNPLLQCIAETFIPLMQQNEVAYDKAVARGQHLFNEAAFDRGEALYDGKLMGHPFRSVVKTFQVVSWRALCQQWQSLDPDVAEDLTGKFPVLHTVS